MKRINDDIKKNSFAHIYLLTGDEDYLRLQYRDKLVKALLGEGDKMNLSRYNGKKTPQDKVIEMAETLPFFAERRVIELSDTGFVKSGGDDLAEYLKSQNESTYFVFDETEIDKRSRLYKVIADKGYVASFEKQDESLLRRWIEQMAAKEGISVEAGVAALILSRCGTDMFVIKNEIEKLIGYCMEKKSITKEDVERICTRQLQDRIFDMMDQVALGRKERAMRLYYDLLSLKEPPVKILALLSNQFRNLYSVKLLKERGIDQRGIAETLKVPGFVARKLSEQASHFKITTLRHAMDDAAGAEEDIKTGKMPDYFALELFMIKYSS